MLTFFDYLRQRAFEAVIAGVQDAYTYLDNHKNFELGKLSAPEKQVVDEANRGEDCAAELPPAAKLENPVGSDGEQPLPPRKRGRPKKNKGAK